MGKRLKIRRKKKTHVKVIVLIVMIVLIATGIGGYFGFRVNQITYTGNKHYDDDQMSQYIFNGHTPNALFFTLFGNKNKSIPFVQKYDVEISWPDKMNITVYEKAIIGYVNYMGSNMYFDKDGIVVESSSDVIEGVPQISGLSFKSIVLQHKLDVGNDDIFNQLLEMTQAFSKYNMNVSKVYFASAYDVVLYMGDVKVMLGDCRECTDKLYTLKQMSDKLEGMKGTLYMQDYNGDSSSIIFKKEN